MTTASDIETFVQLKILSDLSPESRAKLARIGTFHTLPQDSMFLVQGQLHDSLAIILSGRVDVACHAHGDFIELGQLGVGETIGEMNLIDPRKASADVRVKEETRVWILPGKEFEEFVAQDPVEGCRFVRLLARRVCHRLRVTDEKLLHIYDVLRAVLFARD